MKGTFSLILTGFLLGTIGIWVKLIGANVSPFLLTILRTTLASLLILFLISLTKDLKTLEMRRRDLLCFVVAGFFGVAIGFGFFIKSFSYVPVANAVLMNYIYPVSTALLSRIFLKERVTKLEILSIILVVAGVWSIYGSELNMEANVIGNLLAITAGLGYSVFIVSMRFFGRQGLPYWKVTFWPLMTGGLMLFAFLPFEPFVLSLKGMIPLYVLGLVIVSFLGYVFYAKGLKSVRAHNAVIIVSLTEPLTAILLAFAILGETIPQYVMIGGSLIILANILIGREHRRKRMGQLGQAKTRRANLSKLLMKKTTG